MEQKINCESCNADCCGTVGINKDLAKKSEKFLQVKPTKIIEIENDIFMLTKDGKCVYLDRKTKKCAIYNSRPEVCKKFGLVPELLCPFFRPDGTKRTFREKQITQMMIDHQVDSVFEKLKDMKLK